MGPGWAVLADVDAVQRELHRAGACENVALLQGDVAGADALDLAAAVCDVDLDGFENGVVEPRLAVVDLRLVVSGLFLAAAMSDRTEFTTETQRAAE